MADGQINYWDLVDPYWEKVSIYEGYETFLSEFRKIPLVSQNLFAAHWAQSEIRNGGFDQFFWNSTGVLALEAIEGFRAIGMAATAETLQAAVLLLGSPYPHDRDNREEIVDTLDVQFEDVKFWHLLDTEAGGFKVAADAYATRLAGDA